MRIALLSAFTVLAAAALPCAAEPSWHQESGFRWAELSVPRDGQAGFTFLPPEQTGINFTNPLDEHAIAANRVLANGSGVAVGDVDHDGLPDIFLCSLDGHNALYNNLGGMRFKDVTATSGIVCTNQVCRGAVFADVNGDGGLDLLISTTGSGVFCFTNKGDGTFAECSAYAGTRTSFAALTLTLADVDGNGTLDLFVANNRPVDGHDSAGFGRFEMFRDNGRLVVPPSLKDRFTIVNGAIEEYGEASALYLNDGHGRFSSVSWTNGAFLDDQGKALAEPPRDWSLTAAFYDVNGDGAPDLYVCNDYWTPDRFWLNDGRGHFRACPPFTLRHMSKYSMGVDFADIDRDGFVDFCTVDMLARDWPRRKREYLSSAVPRTPIGSFDDCPQIPRNMLFHNRGDNTFEEIAAYAGVAASDWSWQPVFIDVDLDGYEDLIVPAGFPHDANDLDTNEKGAALRRAGTLAPPKIGPDGKPVPRSPQEQKNEELYHWAMMAEPLKTPLIAFRNRGNLQFEDIGPAWGLTQPGIYNGIAFGDFDGDGDLDFVVNNLGSASGVYRNNSSAPRIAVRLKGAAPNTQGIGATIKVLGGSVPLQSQQVVCGGLYLSGSDPMRVFAAGRSESMTIEVTWRNGRKSIVHDAKPNRLYEIDEAGATPGTPSHDETIKPFFQDASRLISHQHHEEFYNDFERQPLLPYQLSQDGPGVGWIRMIANAAEALVIGSGRGGEVAMFAPDGKGGLRRVPLSSKPLQEDVAGIAGWVRSPGELALAAGRADYEYNGELPSVSLFELLPKSLKIDLPATKASTGPLAAADVYGNGTLALFVGGRVIPGRYPEAADSRLYRNAAGNLELDKENSRLLEKVGLVNGAVWSDLDGDGFPELILACEWGPIRVFKNQKGRLHEITADLGLDRYTGWWRGVTTGDIDGDGRLDIIASNWGRNSDYQADAEHPLRLYYGDFTDRGALDLIETVYDPAIRALAPRRMRDTLAAAFPPLLGRFPTQRAYSEATLDQVVALLPKPPEMVQATTLDSMVFFNRTNHFEAVPLPREAQLAPAFAVNVGDFDGDGIEDIFLSQNFFAIAPAMRLPDETGRLLDAGRGLWLRGLGGGKFETVPGQKSGILIYGEQRGAALGDFDEDGRVDLVVAQNGAETKLLHNVLGKPGLRVYVQGPPGNPDAIGATVRLVFGAHSGPAREIHAGSGYWSQDSAVQVLACPETPTQIWIRWPGGKTTSSAIPDGAREIAVAADGTVKKLR